VHAGDPSSRPSENRSRRCDAEALAYLVFTSGSTGQPNPVAITRGSLAYHASAIVDAFGLTESDRVLQFANPGFDVFGEEVFPTLLAGGTVSVLPYAVLPSPAELEAYLSRERITVANLPTPYWEQWVHDLNAHPRPVPEALRLLVVGSDAGHTRTLMDWRRHSNVMVLNAYGLTETTITAVVQPFDHIVLPADGPLPIGRPLAGTEAYLMDAEMRLAPQGSPGSSTWAGRCWPGVIQVNRP
jgi:non-ribosomal peptide synthetase component F